MVMQGIVKPKRLDFDKKTKTGKRKIQYGGNTNGIFNGM